jgi:hypothetical protein
VRAVMNLRVHKTLGSSWVAAQLASSQEGLNSMSEWVSDLTTNRSLICSCVSFSVNLIFITFLKHLLLRPVWQNLLVKKWLWRR